VDRHVSLGLKISSNAFTNTCEAAAEVAVGFQGSTTAGSGQFGPMNLFCVIFVLEIVNIYAKLVC